jgi:putative DNA primase/helicase
MNPEIAEQARNRWKNILPQLGISTSFLTNKQGPCPVCGGKDRFRFDDKEGKGSFYCNNCLSGDGVRLLELKHGWDFLEAVKQVRSVLPHSPEHAPGQPKIDPVRARQGMVQLWEAAHRIDGTEAEAYLRSRGFLPPWSAQLRFIPSVAVRDHPTKNRLSVMIAKVSGPDGTGVNIHRTYLEACRKALRSDCSPSSAISESQRASKQPLQRLGTLVFRVGQRSAPRGCPSLVLSLA